VAGEDGRLTVAELSVALRLAGALVTRLTSPTAPGSVATLIVDQPEYP
jgi:hypothetical protein